VDGSGTAERVAVMRDDQKELLRKWASILISSLALLLTCLMGPIAFTLKATVKDLVRQELTGYETAAASDARWKAHQDYENEVLKRWEHELGGVRDKSGVTDTNNYKLMMEVGNRLSSLEAKLELLMKVSRRDVKSPGGDSGP